MQNERNKLSRQQKIKLLNDLMSGKTTLHEAFPGSIQLWDLTEGLYTNFVTKEVLSEQQFKAKRFRGQVLVFQLAEGCDPIEDDTVIR